MDDEFKEFEDFFNLLLELEIIEKFENTEEFK